MQLLIQRAANDLLRARYAIALTGAGMSTESGIPDFRGPSGVWTKNPAAERAAFRSYKGFQRDPKAWWEERLTQPSALGDLSAIAPNPGHVALAKLEALGRLKCVITQNVDGLHELAGSRRILEYHGSLRKLRCVSCGARFRTHEFDLDLLLAQGALPPRCSICRGVVKTDSVAFGEPIPTDVSSQSVTEVARCDLMLICGTSAVVYPFADLPRAARRRGRFHTEEQTVTIVEINAEPTPLTAEGISDYLIQGQTGEVLPAIVAAVESLA